MDPRTERQIARINELSALARSSWIGLLAYLAFVFVTLLGVQDADFFVPSRQTQLPLVNVSIPTASFFIFAPVLAAALYVYLHLFLIKLWDAIAEAPHEVEGRPLGDAIHPWLVNSLAVSLIGGAARRRRPLDWLSNFVTWLLVWAAGPFVIAAAWWRSMPAHDPWLTGLIMVALAIALLAASASWWRARARLKLFASGTWEGWWKSALGLGVVALLAFVTLGRTSWNIVADADAPFIGRWIERSAFGYLAATSFEGADIVALPPGWREPESAQRAFRETWCRRELVPMAVCDHLPDRDRPAPVGLAPRREAWCAGEGLPTAQACAGHFCALDDRFWSAWESERAIEREALGKLRFSGRDLRWLQGWNVSLVGADLSNARLERSDLRLARMEGVSLIDADLRGALLMDARLAFARARSADLRDANLSGAQLQGAVLPYSDLRGVSLQDARLDRTSMSTVNLRSADMSRATLADAYLGDALLDGARLVSADLDRADLHGASLTDANLFGARLRSADLRRIDLARAALYRADLTDARMANAILVGSALVEAALTGSDLSSADLTHASLGGAKMAGVALLDASMRDADLTAADLSGVILWGTDARSVAWSSATLSGVAPWADLRGAEGLTQAQLDGLIGNRATLIPDGLAPETNRPFTIWSCWAEPPDYFEEILDALVGAKSFGNKYDSIDEARSDMLCAFGRSPEPRGVPCALDLTPQECVDPEANPLHPTNRGQRANRLVPAPAVP